MALAVAYADYQSNQTILEHEEHATISIYSMLQLI